MSEFIKYSGWLDYMNSLNAAIVESQNEQSAKYPDSIRDSDAFSIFNGGLSSLLGFV